MAKRFVLKSGHTIKVDEDDAYMFRSIVWVGKPNANGDGIQVLRGNHALRSNALSHYLVGEYGKPYVVHLNGDTLDYQRANLKAMTADEYATWKGAALRAKRCNSA